MYNYELAQPKDNTAGPSALPPPNPTLKENLDLRIARLEDQATSLKRIREQMPRDLLAMRIQDLRVALESY